jgi:ribonuclease HI
LRYTVYTDGGCNNYKHRDAYGSYVIFNIQGDLIESGSMIFDSNITTSNQAEYKTLLETLKIVIDIDPNGEYDFFTDSMLMTNQINGNWRVGKSLGYLNRKCLVLTGKLKSFSISWVSRVEIVKLLGH